MADEGYWAKLQQTWPARAAKGLWEGLMAPGNAYNSTTPMTSDMMIAPAMNMAGLVTLGAGAVPAGANELRAGIRPYANVPDSLMGYRKQGPQKGFDETKYPHIQDVEVTFPKQGIFPQQTFVDQIKGMNADHAVERAYRNWSGAHITAK